MLRPVLLAFLSLSLLVAMAGSSAAEEFNVKTSDCSVERALQLYGLQTKILIGVEP
jgi:hypothetical protein